MSMPDPVAVAVSPDGNKVYVVSGTVDKISIFSRSTSVSTFGNLVVSRDRGCFGHRVADESRCLWLQCGVRPRLCRRQLGSRRVRRQHNQQHAHLGNAKQHHRHGHQWRDRQPRRHFTLRRQLLRQRALRPERLKPRNGSRFVVHQQLGDCGLPKRPHRHARRCQLGCCQIKTTSMFMCWAGAAGRSACSTATWRRTH